MPVSCGFAGGIRCRRPPVGENLFGCAHPMQKRSRSCALPVQWFTSADILHLQQGCNAPLWTNYALRGSLLAFYPFLVLFFPPVWVFLLPEHLRDPIPPCPWRSAATTTTRPRTTWMLVSSTTAASWTPSRWCRMSSCFSSLFLSSSSVSVKDRWELVHACVTILNGWSDWTRCEFTMNCKLSYDRWKDRQVDEGWMDRQTD